MRQLGCLSCALLVSSGAWGSRVSFDASQLEVSVSVEDPIDVIVVVNGERTVHASCASNSSCRLPLKGVSWAVVPGLLGELDISVYELRSTVEAGGIARSANFKTPGRIASSHTRPFESSQGSWTFDVVGAMLEGNCDVSDSSLPGSPTARRASCTRAGTGLPRMHNARYRLMDLHRCLSKMSYVWTVGVVPAAST